MDVYAPGPGETSSPENQVHDFNPGISPTGLFWTVPLPRDSIEFDGQSAAMHATGLEMPDYFNLINALFGGIPPAPGVVSFDVRWEDPTETLKIRNQASDFGAHFHIGHATVEWSGRAGDYEFVSDPAVSTVSVLAEWGHERNGAF